MNKTINCLIVLFSTLLQCEYAQVYAQVSNPTIEELNASLKGTQIIQSSAKSKLPALTPEYLEWRDEWFRKQRNGEELTRSGKIAEATAFWTPIYQAGRKADFQMARSTDREEHPLFLASLENLSDVAYQQGDRTTALRHIEEFIAYRNGVYKNDRDPRLKLALLLQNAGRYDEAWHHYQYAMNSDVTWSLPKPPPVTREQVPTPQFVFAANLGVAEALSHSNLYQASLFARAAIKANPTSGLPYYYLGETLLDTDLAGAKVAYEKAVQYGHGEVAEKAKRGLKHVQYELTKPQAAKPASTTATP